MPATLHDPQQSPFSNVSEIGVVIRFNPGSSTQQHIGILYKTDERGQNLSFSDPP
jgi:hypothetical protein